MNLRDLIAKFVKFGVVGASGVVVDEGILWLLNSGLGAPALLSKTVGFVCAATSNYFLNRIWTFRSQEKRVGVEYVKFFGVSVVGLGINLLTLHLLMRAFPDWDGGWRLLILNLGAIAVGTLWNFFGNLMFTFRTKEKTS